ncbi:MAG: hypothetical protein LQ351_005121 [Letrouitia transgressa]|nr:MAG: hypothetical protein LQ351_005121 [Letrouitia transgressa]
MLSRHALYVFLTSTFLGVESIGFDGLSQLPFFKHNVHPKVSEEADGLLRAMGPAPPLLGKRIPQEERRTWKLDCTSKLTIHDCEKVIDGENNTFWQTNANRQSIDVLPHSITIDLREIKNVNALSMRPLPDADLGGAVAGHKVYISTDKQTWNLVAFGTWFGDVQDKFAGFEPQPAQFLRLEAISATNRTDYIRIVDIGVWATDSPAPLTRGLGEWGPTVNFPLVPVGAFIDPIGGKVISFSSYAHDKFGQGTTDHTTLTATWDPTTYEISQRHVRETDHDMFCPGMAFDVNGRMIISGGETADKVSIYDPIKDDWTSVATMKIPRGYQGSVTCADGHIFIVGGSWGPVGIDLGDRDGETYDPEKDIWTRLKGIKSENIQTTEDWEKDYRADNHVWLMGWRNNSIFHAGPAKEMHWITTTGTGAVQGAGKRGVVDNTPVIHDRMCGVAAMYDAVEGKILSAGGAPSYNYRDGDGYIRGEKATTNAYVITLDQPNDEVDVQIAGDGGMHFARSFAHAVILPDGETLVVGGQEEPRVFTERTAQLTPEIYSPTKNVWTKLIPNTVPRTYHSFALLLRDATVLVGGGGLTNQLPVNHFDAQIFFPPYLLTEDGARAKRPKITETSQVSVLPGGNFTITVDSEVVSASLVRYGGATHSLNNDQRRIPLTLRESGLPFNYFVSIPADGGVAIPGYYMLFVLDAKGVPSEAKNVKILVAPEYEK